MTTGGTCGRCAGSRRLVATFLYDHKGRLVWAEVAGEVERYLYGDADELLAVTDATDARGGCWCARRWGCMRRCGARWARARCCSATATSGGRCALVTDREGVDPGSGLPMSVMGSRLLLGAGGWAVRVLLVPCFTGRDWYAAIGLYYFGARWYDPELGRFLTPDYVYGCAG